MYIPIFLFPTFILLLIVSSN